MVGSNRSSSRVSFTLGLSTRAASLHAQAPGYRHRLEPLCSLEPRLTLGKLCFIAAFINTFFVFIHDFHLALIQLRLTLVGFSLALVSFSFGVTTGCHQGADDDCEKKGF